MQPLKTLSRRAIVLAALIISTAFITISAQDTSYRKPGFAVESRVTTFLQGGVDLGVYYFPAKSKFSFGILGARHGIGGSTKNWLFESSDHDALDIAINWIFSLQARYHFKKHSEGFYLGVGVGAEEFEVKTETETFASVNAFISPSIGYMWYPLKRTGFYITPKITGTATLFREETQMSHNGTSFRLRPVFATPSFAIGWKF